ncbi:retsat, partial [Symbiodinium necroappetens]
FVHRGKDGRILDVDEFQVAKALLAGELELLSQEVDSKHLFDLCLQFRHQSTAVAMISYGVPVTAGTGVLAERAECGESAAAMPLFRTLIEACRSEASCPTLLTEEAMAYLLDVAILVGDTELARSCARHCNCFPLRRWRFQDFARITVEEQCFRTEIREKDVLIAALAAGLALQTLAFCYSRDWSSFLSRVSLAEAIVLSGDAELWRRVESLQLQLGPWPTHGARNDMALFLRERAGSQHRLSPELLHRAKRAGLPLATFQCQLGFGCQACGQPLERCAASVLDLAILFGQSDCARLCGTMDIKATELTLPASLAAMPLKWEENWSQSPYLPEIDCWCGVSPVILRLVDAWNDSCASLPERQAAAAEALRAALQMSFRRVACSAGFGLFQALCHWARGKQVPKNLVKLVLAFAAERSLLVLAFAGREGELLTGGHWWEESSDQDPQSPQPVVKGAASHVQVESVGVSDMHSAGAAAASSNEARTTPDSTTEKESGPDENSTNDLLAAIRNSKNDNPPLSGDGVVIFRLGRWATSNLEKINAVLFDATGPLGPLHHRVLEAGCEVAPEWSPAKALFVPLTQPQLQELVHSNMYEMGKLHVLALESDSQLIKDAFNLAIPRKIRPKLRRETLRIDEEEEHGTPDDEPLLVLEGGVQTDSSVGYPVYTGVP